LLQQGARLGGEGYAEEPGQCPKAALTSLAYWVDRS
jgi:hypothetical protein